jgi:DUF2934 family protein
MARAKTPRNNAGNTNGQTVAPAVSAAPQETVSEIREVRKTAPDALRDARNNIVPINLEDEIRRRAYELWEQHGHEPGRENEHWLLAEREILARYHAQRQQSA